MTRDGRKATELLSRVENVNLYIYQQERISLVSNLVFFTPLVFDHLCNDSGFIFVSIISTASDAFSHTFCESLKSPDVLRHLRLYSDTFRSKLNPVYYNNTRMY